MGARSRVEVLPLHADHRLMAASTAPSHAIEDYAKAIYSLQRRVGDEAVSTNALAERCSVTPASASAMAKKLAQRGLAIHEPYHGVRLTPKGERLALKMLRHHRLLELYLAEHLDVPWDRVHDEAEALGKIAIGTGGRFVRVSDSDPAMLRYLAEQGIAIGDHCIVTGHQPFEGPITVRVGDTDHILGHTLARAMRLELDDG